MTFRIFTTWQAIVEHSTDVASRSYFLHICLDRASNLATGLSSAKAPTSWLSDEPPGGFDGGLIIDTIQLNHANGSVG